MKRSRVAVSMLTLAALVAGCSGGFGDALHRLSRDSSTSATATPAVSSDEVIAKARPSVVKVHGESENCMKITEGSGFAMTAVQVLPQMAKVSATQATDTGECVY